MMHTSAQSRARDHGIMSMTAPVAFERLVHSDWSIAPAKRWTAIAERRPDGWSIAGLAQTPSPHRFLDLLFDRPGTLAGFDFPIGLPAFYLDKTGIDFCDLLSLPATDRARRFFTPADTLFDISPAQPFYRRHPPGGRQADLLRRLDCTSFDELLRVCDRKTKNRSRAESIFWTVGAKQVGKAALSGWRDILIPARARGARLWPFDGRLSSSHALTLAETYPAEVYRHLGMTRTVRKRTQEGRKMAGAVMLAWTSERNVRLSAELASLVRDGFGERADGEDAFDAITGLCGMIEVADGRRTEALDALWTADPREGWILGQIDASV